VAKRPLVDKGLLIIEASRSRSDTKKNRYKSFGRVISPAQDPLPDNTQHSLGTDMRAPGEIRTRNPSKERPKNHALDRAASGNGLMKLY